MKSTLISAALLFAGALTGFAQVPQHPLASVFGPKIAASLTFTDSAPVSTQILNATGEAATISQNTWVEIKGSNLSQTTRVWGGGDFVDGQMPTALDGVSATINGKSAYVYYVSPVQINVLTPVDSSTGTVPVQVKTAFGTSTVANVTMQQESMGFFAFNSDKYVAGYHPTGDCVNPNNGTCYLGPTSLFPGLTTPAKPGETITIFGNGFGPVDPPITPGSSTQFGALPVNPVVTLGGLPCQVIFAGLVAPGEFQFNIVVPANAPDGDNALSATYNGFTSHPGVFIAVQH